MEAAPAERGSMGEALRQPIFRAIWIGSLFSNFGLLVQGVGAAWAMTQLGTPDKVALVQTANFAPYMLFGIAAGAIADMYDRRIVQIWALAFSLVAASILTICSWLSLITPGLLLGFCFLIGTGMAIFGPAWQSSAGEQVEGRTLPAAIALNSISYNVARSFGPGVGGAIVAIAGVSAAFLCNALFYVPLLITLLRWRRSAEPPRLPPENLRRAILSGGRYVVHSPPIRAAILRGLSVGLIGVAPIALMPLIAKDLLHGGAGLFGVVLCAFGIGAVTGASFLGRISDRLSGETILRAGGLGMGAAVLATAFSTHLLLTLPALYVAGISWMVMIASLNIGVQVPSPRWVTGRTLAIFQAATAGGMAIGSWLWGLAAAAEGTSFALTVAAVLLLCSPLLGFVLRLSDARAPGDDALIRADPEARLALTDKSGPIVIEVEYRVPADRARPFYRHMQKVERGRMRNGGYGWTLSRGIADPEQWVERFHCPTWLDYLRQRSRITAAEQAEFDAILAFHAGDGPPIVRRTLERPFGSVRWNEETRDAGSADASAIAGFAPPGR